MSRPPCRLQRALLNYLPREPVAKIRLIFKNCIGLSIWCCSCNLIYTFPISDVLGVHLHFSMLLGFFFMSHLETFVE